MAEAGTGGFWRVVGWSYAMSWGERVVLLATTFALASWIGPSEFGTFAMATVLVLFLQTFLDQGIATAIVQRRELRADQLTGAFWLMAGAGVGLALLGLALAPGWARFNDLPALMAVTALLLGVLPLQGLIVVQRALLQRELDFRALARFTVAGSLVGAAVGVGLALAGSGVYALVGQQLGAALALSAVVWRAAAWRPALRPSVRPASELLGYASRVYLSAIGRFIHRRSDVAVIGYFFGPAPAGLYFLADRLVNTLTETLTRPITTAALPRFAEVQSDPVVLRHAYLGCARASALVTLPAMAGLAVVAEPALAALGPEWSGVAVVTSILCVLGAARGVTLLTGPMLYAVDRPGLMARLTWLHAALSVPAVLAAGLLLRDAAPAMQTSGVALVRAVVFGLVFMPLSTSLAMRACGVSPFALLRQLRAPLLASAAVLLVGAAALDVCTRLDLGDLASFLLVFASAAVAGIGVVAAADSELRTRMRTVLRERRLEAIVGDGEDERIGGAP